MKSLLDVFPDADSLFQQTRASPLKFAFAHFTAFKKNKRKTRQARLYYFKNMQILHLNVMW